MSEEISRESLGFRDIIVEGSSFDDLEKRLKKELDKLSKEIGVPVDLKKSFFEVCLYSGKKFDNVKAYVYGRAGSEGIDGHAKQSYAKARKRVERIIGNCGIYHAIPDEEHEAIKESNGCVKAAIGFPATKHLEGIIGKGYKKTDEQGISALFDTSAYDEAIDNVFELNENIKKKKFSKEHIKATFLYRFVKVSVEDKERSIKEELEELGIEEKYFDDFFNAEIKKTRKKVNGIIPGEQQTQLIAYFKGLNVLDEKLNVVDKNLKVFENRKISEFLSNVNSNGEAKIIKKDDVYVITNLTLYGLDGLPFMHYPAVELDASPVSGSDSQPISQRQNDWLDYYKNSDKSLLSLPLFYAVMNAIYDNKQDDVAKDLLNNLRPDFKESWISTSSRFNYSKNKVWHDYRTPEQIEFEQNIPRVSEYLENLVNQTKWEAALKAIFMTNNVQKIPEVLGIYSKKARLWTPENNREIERAALVGFSNDDFYVDGYGLGGSSRSRGVRKKFSTGNEG